MSLNTAKVSDSAGLLAIQGEAQALVSRIERVRERLPKGLKGDHAGDILRQAYRDALEGSGVEAMARARGALKAAEQLGISTEEIVGPFRQDKHHEAADEAFRLESLALQVPSVRSVPGNPFTSQSTRGSDFHTNRAPNFLRDRGGPQTQDTSSAGANRRRRKPLWK